jgi:hypothetical protein
MCRYRCETHAQVLDQIDHEGVDLGMATIKTIRSTVAYSREVTIERFTE